MGNLSHTVGGNANLVSFKSAARVPITSAKCEFLPVQEGEGTPSPENIRPIRGWNSVDLWQDKEYILLPKEYQRVEYLEATGTQYILTDYSPINNISAELTFMFTQTQQGDMMLYGTRAEGTTAKRISAELYNHSSWYAAIGTIVYSGVLNTVGKVLGQRYDMQINESNLTIDGASVSPNNTYDENTLPPMCLFGWNNNGTPKLFCRGLRLYKIKFYENNISTANYIPCCRKSDSKPGMYDIVSNTFYTNAGTGEFICGPDCGETISVEFPVLGKNKFKVNVPDSVNDPLELNTKTKGKAYNATSKKWIDGTTYPHITNITIGTDTISFTEGNATAYGVGYCLALIPNQTYTLSATCNYGAVNIHFFTKDKEYINRNTGIFNASFTVPTNAYYSYINLTTSHSNVTVNYSNIQLELGDTATTYEPYNSNNTVYGGYIDVAQGELVATYGLVNTTWGDYDQSYDNVSGGNLIIGEYERRIFTFNTIFKAAANCNGFSNISDHLDGNEVYNTDAPFFNMGRAMGIVKLPVDTSANFPVQFSGLLANPITYKLTPTQLNTLLGQNNIWSNTNSNTAVSYAIHEAAPIRAAKHRIAAAEPHIAIASGNLAHFETDMIAPVKNVKIYFNPVQEGSGDPSPSNVRAISGRNKLNIYSFGKGIRSFKTNSYEVTSDYFNGNANWCSAIINSTALWGQTVTYSADINATNATGSGAIGIIKTKADGTTFDTRISGTVIDQGNTGRSQITFQIPGNGIRIYPAIIAYKGCIISNPMIEIGNTATEYELMNGITTSVDWQDDYGTLYGGYIDLIKGELVQEWNEIIVDGINVKINSNYSDTNYICGGLVYLQPYGLNDGYSISSTVLCNNMKVYAASNAVEILPSVKTISNGKQYLRFYLANTLDHPELDTKEKILEFCNNYFVNNPTQIIYKLDTPIVHYLTPSTLKSLRGQNNIWSSANGPVEIQYYTH